MAYLAQTEQDGQVAIPMDETLALLQRTLPRDHPTIREVERCFDLSRGVMQTLNEERDRIEQERAGRPDYEGITDELSRLLSDWRRGIRDWEEVQPAFERAAKAADWLGV